MGTIASYAVEAWILPLIDPDSAPVYSTIMDQLVPKDTDVQSMDLDTVAADATPFWEPGEADWSKLIPIGFQPERIYHRHRHISFGTRNTGFSIKPTGEINQWWPTDSFDIRIRKNYFIENPSVMILGFSNPSNDDTDAVEAATALTESEIPQIRYVGDLLRRALLALLGVTETGAETPWEEASLLLQKHLEPQTLEDTGGFFAATTWHIVTDMVIDHSVEGEMGRIAVTTG